MLNREAFLAAGTLQKEAVTIPGLPDEVFLQELTHEQFSSWVIAGIGEDGRPASRDSRSGPKLLVLCLVDAEGQRLFTDEDVPLLAAMPSRILGPLVARAQQLNGFGDKAVKETVKNSGGE